MQGGDSRRPAGRIAAREAGRRAAEWDGGLLRQAGQGEDACACLAGWARLCLRATVKQKGWRKGNKRSRSRLQLDRFQDGRRPACIVDGSWLGRQGYGIFWYNRLRTWVGVRPRPPPPHQLNTPALRHAQCPRPVPLALLSSELAPRAPRNATQRNETETNPSAGSRGQRHLDVGHQPGPGVDGGTPRMVSTVQSRGDGAVCV